jgi:hypothetical protein
MILQNGLRKLQIAFAIPRYAVLKMPLGVSRMIRPESMCERH